MFVFKIDDNILKMNTAEKILQECNQKYPIGSVIKCLNSDVSTSGPSGPLFVFKKQEDITSSYLLLI